uniref:30s ribosomal protein s1 n=1 Tax=Tetraselmis sp. GSL018 TaxID=582737 RepID=A0A061QV27_9CHLO
MKLCTSSTVRPSLRIQRAPAQASFRQLHNRTSFRTSGFSCRSLIGDVDPRPANGERDEITSNSASTEDSSPASIGSQEPEASDVTATSTPPAVSPKVDEEPSEKATTQRKDAIPKEVIEEVPFQVGDVVVGEVLYGNDKGSRIKIIGDIDGLIGYVSSSYGPCLEPCDANTAPLARLPRGYKREFKIANIPERMEVNGMGPLLSARPIDEEIIWQRLEQMKEASQKDLATYNVRILRSNKGGVLSSMMGIELFIPYSKLLRPQGTSRWNEEVASDLLVGKDLCISIADISRTDRNIIGDQIKALEQNQRRIIVPGALVTGTVRTVKSYGFFVLIDGTRSSGLLHMSAISRAYVDTTENLLMEGDRVSAIVNQVEDDFNRISLTTEPLEKYPGEIIENKEEVFATASERFRELVEESQN